MPKLTDTQTVVLSRAATRPCNLAIIRYGYTTYLEPYDILTNHKRRYFNYIRCNTVRVTISQPQNVIDSIKEMLLNGVWLFSYVNNESIFKLDGVVNMPANLGIEV